MSSAAQLVLRGNAVDLSYVLPLRASAPTSAEFTNYIAWLSRRVQLIVVDGSSDWVFNVHAQRWSGLACAHVPPDPDLLALANGKVGGVLTGVRRAAHELIVIADDDVRYDEEGLTAMTSALAYADVVRPQNYFDPLPWHACLDTGRTLLNRISGGDWPGTLGVRRTAIAMAGGYDGDVLFENLELVRTIVAAGGTEACLLDLYVRRLPPTTKHFWSQRIRQAYDEFARPRRLAMWLSVAPATAAVAFGIGWWAVFLVAAACVGAAEAGRRRKGGIHVFPEAASFAAPVWVAERAVCAWLALGACVTFGGVPYSGRIISRAATPFRVLERRLRGVAQFNHGGLR